MSWDTLLSYVKALPDGIELTDDKNNVVIKPQGIVLSVAESHSLILNAIKSVPSTETVKFLNEYIKENASDLSDDEVANLPEHLSTKMNGLHLSVKIAKSLTETLLAAKGGTYNPDPENGVNEHKVSVVLQISKPGETVYEATGSNVTKQIPFLKYNNPDQFSIAFKLEELNETVFEDNINDVEAPASPGRCTQMSSQVVETLHLGCLACSYHPAALAGERQRSVSLSVDEADLLRREPGEYRKRSLSFAGSGSSEQTKSNHWTS